MRTFVTTFDAFLHSLAAANYEAAGGRSGV